MASKLMNRFRILGFAAAMLAVPAMQADTASIQLTGVGNGSTMGGVYVSPYTATVNGVSTLVICDDFYAHTSVGQTWTANVTYSGGNLSNTRVVQEGQTQTQAQALYNRAAWLVTELLAAYSSNNRARQGQLSFAVWGLFDPSSLGVLNTTDRNAAQGFINDSSAWAGVLNSSLVIYTPTPLTSTSPQEYLAIRTPEGSAGILWGLNLAAMALLVTALRRRAIRL